MRTPNIVLLYADDLGYGDLRCYAAASKIPTPNLDRLASEGLRFTDAHSSSGICTPSRYALLTGRHHWRQFHGIVESFGPSVLPPERLTLPEMLREHGYRTACIGKWHLGWDWSAVRREGAAPRTVDGKSIGYAPDAFDWSKAIPDGPLAHGFEHYFGDDVPNFPPYAWIDDDRLVRAPTAEFVAAPRAKEGQVEGRPGPMVEGWRLDEVMPTLTEHAVEWLRDRRGDDRPFFLYFPFTSPHAPIVPRSEFEGASEAGPYGDFVAQTDATVGRVLAALDELGLRDDTLVIFSSDNGPEGYAFERVRATGHRSAGDLRGLKRDLWEGGHRVPMIVRWPGVVAPGTTTDALVSQCDWLATLASVLGYELPDDAAEDSFDLLTLLRGETERVHEFLVHNTFANKYAIRRGDWLLIDAPGDPNTKPPEWFTQAQGYEPLSGPCSLFDLRRDVGQRHDVAAEHPELVIELRELLRSVREAGHSAPRLAKR